MTDVPSNDSTHRSTLDPVPVYDLQHHIASKPLERQYAELVAIHFGSFALARGPLMSKTTAKKFVKYLWSITLGLLPYDGPADPPPITAHDITYAISYAKSLIKCGKAVARLLAVTHFDPLTRTYPDDDTSFLFSNRDVDPVKDNISADDGPFRHSAIGMIICRMLTFDSKGDICISSFYFYPKIPKILVFLVCGLLRFALDEFSTGSYLKLSFTEWAQEYSWGHVERLWDSAKELQGGAYLDGVQRSLAEQLRNSILNSRHSILDTPPAGPLFPWDQPDRGEQSDIGSARRGHDTDATLVD